MKNFLNWQNLYKYNNILKRKVHIEFKIKSINKKENATYLSQVKRCYGIKLYSHHYQEKTTYNHKIVQYIKSLNEYKCKDKVFFSNIYDKKFTIQQLQDIIFNLSQPEPEDILRLFVLYSECSRSTLYPLMIEGNYLNHFASKLELSLSMMTIDQIHQLSISLNKLRFLRWKPFNDICFEVYNECLKRLKDTYNVEEVMRYFIIGLELYGNIFYKKKHFSDFIKTFEYFISTATPSQLVHILHFTGFAKSAKEYSNFLISAITRLSTKFDNISFIEAGLAISSLFKAKLYFPNNSILVSAAAIKLNNKLIQSQSEKIIEVDSLEMFSMISIIKFLRKCNYYNIELLTNLVLFLKKLNLNKCDAPFICHSLAMFSNSNYYNYEVFSILEDTFLTILKLPEPSIRIKDISRIMWAFSHMKHNCKDNFLNEIKLCLESFSKTGELLLHPNHFVDILLALSIYDIYNGHLNSLTFQKDFVAKMKEEEKSRQQSRLLLLHQIHNIIFPEHSLSSPTFESKLLPHRTISTECTFRPAFKHILNAVFWLEKHCGRKILDLKFLILHINYASLVHVQSSQFGKPTDIGTKVLGSLEFFGNQKIAIEIEDSHNTILGDNRLIGIEHLKRNLLRRQGWNIHVITDKQIESYGGDIAALSAFLIQVLTSNDYPD